MMPRPHAPFPATSTGRVVSAVPVGRLVPHEEHDERRALRLAGHIGRVGVWTAPLVIERDSLVVMDGHHRLRAAQALGLSVLPAVLLSYEDAGVLLQAWRKGEVWSPAAVLSRGRSGLLLLPRKTTRHLFQPAIGSVGIPLGWLATQREPEMTGAGLRPSAPAGRTDLKQSRPASSVGPSNPGGSSESPASYAQIRQRLEAFGTPSLEQADSQSES
jgi:hypothetical protein